MFKESKGEFKDAMVWSRGARAFDSEFGLGTRDATGICIRAQCHKPMFANLVPSCCWAPAVLQSFHVVFAVVTCRLEILGGT